MRFITNCCGEVLKHKSSRTPFLSSCPKKWNCFGIYVHLKTPSRKLSSELKDLHQNPAEDFSNSFAKLESLHLSNFTRNLLHSETDDKIINVLKSCYSLEDVLQIVNADETLKTDHQLNQAIIELADLRKLHFLRYILTDEEQNFYQLCNSPSFRKMLSSIESNIDKMNATEISYCLSYLKKLNVNCYEPVMMKLIDAFEKSIFHSDKDLLLPNLSRFFQTIKDVNNIWSLFTMNYYLPFLIESLNTCDNHDDYRHITDCFRNCVPLLNSDILKKYISKLDLALQDDEEKEDMIAKTSTLLKSIVFLSFKHWKGNYINEIKQLMAAMKGKSRHLCFAEVGLLHKAAISLLEPFDLLQEIEETTKTRIKTYQNTDPSIPIFIFQLLYPREKLMTSDEMKNYLTKCAEKNSLGSSNFNHFSDLHGVIFNLDFKFDKSITSTYWSMLVNLLKDAQQRNSENFLENLTWCIHKYIHLIGTQGIQRNDFVEKSLVSIISSIISDDKFTFGPVEYTNFYLTILALENKNPFHFFTEDIWQNLFEYLPRLGIYDNLFVSLILRISYDRFKERKRGLDKFTRFYTQLNAAVNANISDNLRRYSDSLPDLQFLYFSYLQNKEMKTSETFVLICDRFQDIKVEQLYSRIIRDSIFDFTTSGYLIPEFTDVMVEYCIKEKNTLLGATVAHLVNFCFSFGYVPDKMDKFLPIATSLIERDKEIIPKLMYIQSALALSYFGELPSTWCDYIFNDKFLEQLDTHLSNLNIKKSNILRKDLMELNRAICINYPNRRIPWFHEKYCQSLYSERKTLNNFLASVLSVLKTLVKADGAIKADYITSYGHRIDVVLFLSENGQMIDVKHCDPSKLRKIALILVHNLPTSSYYKGKGKLELFSGQLEALNFEVIPLSKSEWNSLHLSNLQTRTNYLRKLIWPTS